MIVFVTFINRCRLNTHFAFLSIHFFLSNSCLQSRSKFTSTHFFVTISLKALRNFVVFTILLRVVYSFHPRLTTITAKNANIVAKLGRNEMAFSQFFSTPVIYLPEVNVLTCIKYISFSYFEKKKHKFF